MRMRVFKMSSLLLILVMSMIKVQAATYTVTNVDDTGAGSLRDAITQANASPGQDNIQFNIPEALTTGGKFVINCASNMNITESVIITGPVDGLNQPRVHVVNTGLASARAFEFAPNCDNSEIKNLEISGFGYGIILPTSKECIIENNYLHENGFGVGINGACDSTKVISNLIDACTYGIQLSYGGTTPNRVSIGVYGKGNIIQNCTQYAITYFAQPSDNLIQYNTIQGCQAGGIQLAGGAYNFIIRHNEILENNGHGIVFSSGQVDNLIEKNYIGVDRNGNPRGNTGSGIHLNHWHDNDVIGNVIAYNQNGITVGGTATSNQNKLSRNIIYGNTDKAINLNLMMATPGNNGKPSPLILGTYTTDMTGYQISGMAFPNDSIELYSTEFNVQNIIKHIGSLQAAGDGTWSYTIPYSELPDSLVLYVTAIGIDVNNNTSEVSNSPIKLTCSCEVVNTNNDGEGSLRQAFYCANAKKSHAVVTYAIPGAGPYTIALSGAPLFVINPYGITTDGQSQVTSGAGTGDQTVTIQSGFIFSQPESGPSTISNLTFRTAPFGIYSLADSITVTNNEFIQAGLRIDLTPSTDENRIIVQSNTFTDCGQGMNASYINGLIIEDNIYNHSGSGSGFSISNSTEIVVSSNEVTMVGLTGVGFNFSVCKHLLIESNELQGTGNAFQLVGADTGVIRSNRIVNTSRGIVYGGNVRDFSMEGNYIQNYDYGYGLYGGSGTLTRVIIEKDTVLDGNIAMHLNITDCKVDSCYIDNCTNGLEFPSNQGTIFNSIISNNSIQHFTAYGIWMGQGGQEQILNNFIGNGTGDGIYVPRSHDGTVIKGNFIGVTPQLTAAPIQGRGINMSGMSGFIDFTIEKNTIGNIDTYMSVANTGVGIYYQYSPSTDILFRENYIGVDSLGNAHWIDSSGFRLINLNGGLYTIRFTGNEIGATLVGIDSRNSRELLFSENIVSGVENAFMIQGASAYSNKLSKNTFRNIVTKEIELQYSAGTDAGNNGKLSPSILSFDPQLTEMAVVGNNAVKKDTVEIYQGGAGLGAFNRYVGYAVSDESGNWTTIIPYTALDLNRPMSFYATATDTLGNTSEFGVLVDAPCLCVVFNTNDAGLGSLREAINCANTDPDVSEITFSIPGNGPHTIQPLTELPIIIYSTQIDASIGGEQIIIDGTSIGVNAKGFIFGDQLATPPVEYCSSSVRGIKMQDFRYATYAGEHDVVKIESSQFKEVSNLNYPFSLQDTLWINDCYFSKGSSLIPGLTNFTTDEIIVTNSVVDSCMHGFNAFQSNSIHLENNTFIDNTNSGVFTNMCGEVNVINNIIYGNTTVGINISSSGSTVIKGNIVGLDSLKQTKRPNGNGVRIRSTNAVVDSNYISGNNGYGIITELFSNVKVSRNYIGTNDSWQNLGNTSYGINSSGSSGALTVGGSTLDSANYIGFNQDFGVNMYGGTVQNNYIGVTPVFTDMGNLKSGVNAQMFGMMKCSGNYIGFNHENGILTAAMNEFYDNFIGGDTSSHNFANLQWGIAGFSNGLAEGNIIAHNELGGISVTSDFGKISQNIFLGDQPLAISLNGGTGNQNQQPAVFTTFTQNNTSLTLNGTGVDGEIVEVFLATAPETAQRFVGSATVTGGTWSINVPAGPGYDFQQDAWYVNTATSATNNTSQLSARQFVPVSLCGSTSLNIFNSTPLQVCVGDSVLVDAGIITTAYSWTRETIEFATTQQAYLKGAGEIVLTVTDSYNCSASDTVTIVDRPLPEFADFLMTSVAGINDPVVVVNITPSLTNVTWDFGTATSTATSYGYDLVYATAGDYEVTMTSHLNSCSRVTTHYIHINPVGTPPVNEGGFTYYIKDVTIAPNPSDGVFNIIVDMEQAEGVTVEILTSLGMPVYNMEYTDKVFTHVLNTDIQHLATGQYIVRITSQSDSRILRIVKL